VAAYILFGAGNPLTTSYDGRPFAETLLYQNGSEACIVNSDGTKIYFLGSGFVWNKTNHRFTAGLVARIRHYSKKGAFIDSIEGLEAGLPAVEAAFESVGGKPDAAASLLLKGDDTLDASDRVNGRALPAVLSGGPGNDRLEGGKGADLLAGDDGEDRLSGGDARDRLIGGPGNDVIDGGNDEDVIKPGPGDDLVYGGHDPDVIVYDGPWRHLSANYSGSDYSINVVSGEGTDKVFTALTIATDDGTHRYDVPTAQWINESLRSGVEWLYPERFVKGSEGSDVIDKSSEPPNGIAIDACGGDDVITGGELVLAGAGDDQVTAAIRAYGDKGNDRLVGCHYADGGRGNDIIQDGASGSDDVFEGGKGADVFRFRVNPLANGNGYSRHGNDRIADFRLRRDHLDIRFADDVPVDKRGITMKQAGADTVVTYAGGTITLQNFDSTGVTIADLLL
jgi:Ca2+-binding RTX toxin-like protein